MKFHPNFNKYAEYWCKKCGEGDSIMVNQECHVSRSVPLDSPLAIGDETTTITETNFRCSFCDSESEDIEDLITESQHEAHIAFCKRIEKFPIDEEEEEYEDS